MPAEGEVSPAGRATEAGTPAAAQAATESGAVELLAPAKLNLALEVLGRRDDGYHTIDTVLTTIDLADTVRLTPRESGAGLTVSLDGPRARGIDPTDDLAGRAARTMADAAQRAPDLEIAVTKRIPAGAGLGGGSSDAAAVLRGLNELWELAWPPARLEELGAALGSDVPFFLHAGAARCTGRGERVEPLRDLRPLRALVIVPPVPPPADKTARRYAALTAADFTDGRRSRRLAARLARGAPPPTSDLVNAFEAPIERTEPELVAHYAAYAQAGLPRLHLCGAGAAVYCFVPDDAKLAALRRAVAAVGGEPLEVRTLPRERALAVRRLSGAAR